MAIKSERELLEQIAAKVLGAKALNGEFERMTGMIEHMHTRQGEHGAKLDKLSDAMYDPDNGVFSRIKMVETTVDACLTTMDTHLLKEDAAAMVELKHFKEGVENVAGKQLQELASVIQIRKNFSKIYWVLVSSIVLFVGAFLFQLIKHTP